ncbi:hypothetical protein GN956_G20022 [Arapaima gigas]
MLKRCLHLFPYSAKLPVRIPCCCSALNGPGKNGLLGKLANPCKLVISLKTVSRGIPSPLVLLRLSRCTLEPSAGQNRALLAVYGGRESNPHQSGGVSARPRVTQVPGGVAQ